MGALGDRLYPYSGIRSFSSPSVEVSLLRSKEEGDLLVKVLVGLRVIIDK